MTCRTLETFYHINGHLFEKQYKESLSGFRDWEQLEHAEEWLLFAENIGPRLAIDETSLSNGELYTFVTNRDAHTREQSLVAVVSGTKSEDIIDVLKMIDQDKLNMVEEVTLDLSDSMRKAVRTIFPRANRVIDCFHIQKYWCPIKLLKCIKVSLNRSYCCPVKLKIAQNLSPNSFIIKDSDYFVIRASPPNEKA